MKSRAAALVTGASRGIGEGIARRLAQEGYDLTVSARSEGPLRELATSLSDEYGTMVNVVEADMASESEVRALAAAHLTAHDRADVLVLNAGMGSIGRFADYPVGKLDRLFQVNMRSAYVLTQELLPALRAAGQETEAGGKVIAISSTTGLVGEPLNSAYGATKAALISWCETVTTEESEGGVVATAVCPGYVRTTMTENLPGETGWEQMLPVHDVVEAVAFLTRLSKYAVIPNLVLTRPGPHLWRA